MRLSRHRLLTRTALAAASTLLAAGLAAPAMSPAAADKGPARWAPEADAKIHPGTQMYTKGAQCTANFVFTDDRGRVYVGYAAHCAGLGGSTDTNGCESDSMPLGTRVVFREGGSLLSEGQKVGDGRLAYSAWRTMHRLGTTEDHVCSYNDFALVRVSRDDVASVNPTVPGWGGPSGVDTDGLEPGETVSFYGNSSLLGGAASQRTATVQDTVGRGWSHEVRSTVSGVPGDSGSGYLSDGGRAVGVLSTIAIFPDTGANHISDLEHVLRFAQRHSGIPGLRMVKGTRAFGG